MTNFCITLSSYSRVLITICARQCSCKLSIGMFPFLISFCHLLWSSIIKNWFLLCIRTFFLFLELLKMLVIVSKKLTVDQATNQTTALLINRLQTDKHYDYWSCGALYEASYDSLFCDKNRSCDIAFLVKKISIIKKTSITIIDLRGGLLLNFKWVSRLQLRVSSFSSYQWADFRHNIFSIFLW